MKRNHMLLQLFLMLCICFQGITVFFFKHSISDITLKFLQAEIFFLLLWNILSAKIFFKVKFTNLYLLFTFTFTVFILSRILLDLFDMLNFQKGTFFLSGVFFTNYESAITLIYILLFLISVHFGFVAGNKSLKTETITNNKSLEKIGKIIFFTFLLGAVVKAIYILKFSWEYGYIAMYLASSEDFDFPVFVSGATTFLLLGYCLILGSKPSKKTFLLISFIYFLVKVISLLTGERGGFIITLFFLVWYYYTFYAKKDINIVFGGGMAFGLILLTQMVVLMRDSKEISEGFLSLVITFFEQQGVSLQILQFMVRYNETFINNGLPYILSGFTTRPGTGQTVKTGIDSTYLGDRLSYFLNPSSYLHGNGMGSSFLGEFYDLGIVLFIIFSAFTGVFIAYFSRNVLSNRILLMFSYFIVTTLLWMPRGNFLPYMPHLFMVFFSYMLILLISKRKKS